MKTQPKSLFLVLAAILLIAVSTGCTGQSDSEEPGEFSPECTDHDLIQAIDAANLDGVPSIIHLPPNCHITLDQIDNSFTWNSMTINSGLPLITSEITIRGNNSVIDIQQVSPGNPFGHLFLTEENKLALYDLTLSNGIRPVGGAVINNQGDLYLHNVYFLHNKALPILGTYTGQGGAVFNYIGKLRIMANSIFEQNMAGETLVDSPHAGGAVFSINSMLMINNSYFLGNYAAGNGGAVYTVRSPGISGGNLFTIQNTEFWDNYAIQDGGGLYMKDEEQGVFMVTSDFSDNQAGGLAGAIYAQDSDLTADYTNFYGNIAEQGGAVYTKRTAEGEISSYVSDHSIYTYNQASGDGGAIFSENSDLELHDTIVLYNQAASCGGLQLGGYPGMDVAAGDLETAPRINSSSEISASSISYNQALSGFGGGACHLMGELELDDVNFTENATPTFGGGLITMDKLNATASVFEDNLAFRGGGLAVGFPVDDNNPLSPAFLDFYSRLTGCWVTENAGQYQGGGIWANSGGTLHIVDSSISGNSTLEEGGGIYLDEGNLYLNNSTLAENTAGRGGGLYSVGENSDLQLIHTTIAYNNATDGGSPSRPGGGGINTKNLSLVMRQVLIVLNTNEDCTFGPIKVTGGTKTIFDDKYHVNIAYGVDSDGTCIVLDTEVFPQIGIFNGTYVPIQGGSPLIDRPYGNCYFSTDQIGTTRKQGSSCEPGSIEYLASAPPPPPPPAPEPGDEQNCDPFANLEVSVRMLNINPDTYLLPVYLNFSQRVPNLPADGSIPFWAQLGGATSYLANQQGFDNRIYFMFELGPEYPGTLQTLDVYWENCGDPVFTQPRLTIPELPLSCNNGLDEKTCKETGGTWLSGLDDPYCLCP